MREFYVTNLVIQGPMAKGVHGTVGNVAKEPRASLTTVLAQMDAIYPDTALKTQIVVHLLFLQTHFGYINVEVQNMG